ncbi:MAG: UDP-N-acetylmuramate dehydrogenase [Selenomonadaceae bacterium]
MQINKAFVEALQKVLPAEHILLNEPMSRHTTFKIGGPADCLIFPASMDEVKNVFDLLHEYEIPFTVLGNGSNVLVLDKGIRGATVKFNSPMSYIYNENEHIFVGAGAPLKDVSQYAAKCSLTGMEFAVGIPGSIGGAVFMNAGAYDGEIKNIVRSVKAVTVNGEIVKYSAEQLAFGYRHSIFQENGYAICEVEIVLKEGQPEEIKEKMDGLTKRRESRQPLEMPSAGSTFKRPQGYFAGTLIEESGLKGFKVGGAQISLKHAGFVVNAGGATAEDVLKLIKEVQKRVYERHGIKLFPEVRMMGEQ